MSIADKAHAPALQIDGQDAPTTALRSVQDPATGDVIADATAAVSTTE